MPEYTHTLIPGRVDFVPEPQQLSNFLATIETIGATPLEASITLSKLTGQVRTFQNPFTGLTESSPIRSSEKLQSIDALPAALTDCKDYNIALIGKGPPRLPAFVFDFDSRYDFIVRCCQREAVVSTSDWHDEVAINKKVKFFEEQCSPDDRLGIFHHPDTLKVIEVPHAGCARFWIEFEFGKSLFPKIEDRLDLIEPKIIKSAEQNFGVQFVQGCRWCA